MIINRKVVGGGVDPAKGLVLEDYDSEGYPTTARFVGFRRIPDSYLAYAGHNASRPGVQFFKKITFALSDTINEIGKWSFRDLRSNIDMSNFSNIDKFCDSAFKYAESINQDLVLKDGVILEGGCFYGCNNLKKVIFLGNALFTGSYQFGTSCNIELYDFSNATVIPSISRKDSVDHKKDCIIKVPQSLLSEWQAATNWCDLTDVIWQGV